MLVCLEFRLVAAKHIKAFKHFFLCVNLLLFALFGFRFKKSSCAKLGYNKVAVGLFFELPIRFFKRFAFFHFETRHSLTYFLVKFESGIIREFCLIILKTALYKVSFKKISLKYQAYFTFVLVAQLNRATGCGPVGRGFESLRARHFYTYFKIILQNLEYSRAVMFRVFGKKHIVKKMIEN